MPVSAEGEIPPASFISSVKGVLKLIFRSYPDIEGMNFDKVGVRVGKDRRGKRGREKRRRAPPLSPILPHVCWVQDIEEHVEFVYEASRIYCRLYQIAEISKGECRALAGNIIPGMVTITSTIAAMMCLNLLMVRLDRYTISKTRLKTKN